MNEVLVGDVVLVFEGMEIPADGLVLEASDLTGDESAMTGESVELSEEGYKSLVERSIKWRR